MAGRNFKNQQKAVFLDRINSNDGDEIKKINGSGFLVILFLTSENFSKRNEIETMLSKSGAFLDAIYSADNFEKTFSLAKEECNLTPEASVFVSSGEDDSFACIKKGFHIKRNTDGDLCFLNITKKN